MNEKHCLECGMLVSDRETHCPKCDNRLDRQTDGSTITVDIAHHGERVHDALRKMDAAVNDAKSGVARYLRLVVGSGIIREEVLMELREMEHRKVIVKFHLDGKNSGAYIAQLKP